MKLVFKTYITVLIFSAISCLASFGQMSFGEPEKINEDWKFILQDNQNFKAPSYKDESWQNVSVPHDWSVRGQLDSTLASATGYLPGGIGWYRKNLDIPANKKGQRIFLYFEGVYNRSEVYVNGELLGKRPNGYISFAYDATSKVKFGESNTIAVRVDHSQSADSRWYTGSGIYRDVWLVYANPIHIAQWGVYAYPELKEGNGILNIEVEIVNDSGKNSTVKVINELIDHHGKKVAQTSNNLQISAQGRNTLKTKLELEAPDLWTLKDPCLYELKTTILMDKKPIDKSTVQTGFREFTFDPNKGFALNGKWMKMKGVCLHHDSGVLGSAFYKDVWENRLKTLREIGVNAIRTSHNPQDPKFYELCDELGLLVLNEAYDEWEFPKRKWLDGWNVGKPGFQGSYDIFADWSEKDLADMVKRDRNHISIFAWSIGNEVDYPNDPYSHPILEGGGDSGFSQAVYGGYKEDAPDAMRLGAIAERLVATVKQYDKSRPTTAGLAGVAMSNFTEYPGALDITGYNYTESRYQSDHKKYPNRVIYGSETRHDYKAWLAVKRNDHIFGQFLWTGIDYLGESREWPSRGFYSGLLDFMGRIKPRGYFRQSLWSDKPMIYIGTYPANKTRNKDNIDAWPSWNYKDGEDIKVFCYTNADKARLELNGKVVGEEQPYNTETGVLSWKIPFQSGKLEAIGMNEVGEEESRYMIVTTSNPHALKIVSDNRAISNSDRIAKVRIEIQDEEGNKVVEADNEVECVINGPGELLGLESANNSDMNDYTDNKHNAHRGEILAYIKVLKTNEPIMVRFNSAGLKPAEINLKN